MSEVRAVYRVENAQNHIDIPVLDHLNTFSVKQYSDHRFRKQLLAHIDYLLIELDGRLNSIVRTKKEGDLITLEVFGCTYYRFNRSQRHIRVGRIDRVGNYHEKDAVFELFRPLSTSYWLWFFRESLSPFPGKQEYVGWGEIEEWLYSVLLKDSRFISFRAQWHRQHFPYPEILLLCQRAHWLRDEQIVDSNIFEMVWKNLDQFRLLDNENSNLLSLYLLAMRAEVIDFELEPTQALKRHLRSAGVSRKVWRHLLQDGVEWIASDLEFEWSGYRYLIASYWSVIQEYLLLRTVIGVSPLEDVFFQCLRNAPRYHLEIPTELTSPLPLNSVSPAILRIISAHYISLTEITETDVQKITLIVLWDLHLHPILDRHQRRAGWRWALKQAQIWRQKRLDQYACDHYHWRNSIGVIHWGRYHIEPLESGKALLAEAIEMKNCLLTFAERCQMGRYQLYRVHHCDDGIFANMGFYIEEGIWALDDIKGPRNNPVGLKLLGIAQYFEKFINQQLSCGCLEG
ncbi:MAG: hypothetical protein HQL48_08660 [Gammaproteobacteria bacterium]|nr:hypothetical protein [Gammaproteobacteria bacterium]